MFKYFSYSAAFILLTPIWTCSAAAEFKIRPTSIYRAVCNIKFDRVDGLVVNVKKIQQSTLKSRINIERYRACPYDVQIEYAGRSLSVDFTNALNGERLTADSVYNYDPATPVYVGSFIYDGEKWKTNMGEGVDAKSTLIKVRRRKKSIDVRGPIHGHDLGTGLEFFCYGVSIINHGGGATTGICSPKREDVTPWQNLFESKAVIRSVE